MGTFHNTNTAHQSMQGLVSRLSDVGFNNATVLRLQALDPDDRNAFMQRAFTMFAEVLEEQSAAVEAALRDNDWEKVRGVAHMIRSSSVAVGADGFSVACAQLEERLLSGRGPQEQWRAEAVDLVRAARSLRQAVLGALGAQP